MMHLKTITFVTVLLGSVVCGTDNIFKDFTIIPSACLISNELGYFLSVSIVECLQACVRRKMCAGINYNWPSASCFLFKGDFPVLANGTIADSSRDFSNGGGSICNNVLVESVPTWLVSGPCGLRPCGLMSLCRDVPGQLHGCDVAYCESSTTIPHAVMMSQAPTRVGQKNSLKCVDGYHGIGKAALQCSSGGFTSTNFYCVKTCPTVPKKTGARLLSVSLPRLQENSTATYECTVGFYNLSTVPAIQCQSDGQWSQFECTPACQETNAPKLTDGFISNRTSKSVWNTIFDHLEYDCNYLHYLSPGNSTIQCDIEGQWSALEVLCYKHCLPGAATVPQFSMLAPGYDAMYTFGEVLNYTCEIGYYAWPGSFQSVCESTGTWTTPSAVCFPHCPVPSPAYGIPQAADVTQFVVGNTISYSCDGNHYFNGQSVGTATCKNDGTWSYDAQCHPYCGDPPGIGNYGVLSSVSKPAPFTVGTTAKYSCNTGLYASPSDTKNCVLTGGWSGHVGCCFFTHHFDGDSCVWGR